MAERRRVLSNRQRFGRFQPSSAVVRVEIAALSERGAVRPHNEDHYLALRLGRFQETLDTSLSSAELPSRFEESAYVMLVADGLGGGGTGALASRVALSTVAHLALRYGKWNVRVGVEEAKSIKAQSEFFFQKIHDIVFRTSNTDPRLAWMSTSLTAAYTAGLDLFFTHVGHSRAYVFHEGTLSQLTRDGGLTELLGAQRGEQSDPRVQIEHLQLRDGDRVLLCTNGLTDGVADEEIADVLALRRRPAEDCRTLVGLAEQKEARDNVTVILADYTVPETG